MKKLYSIIVFILFVQFSYAQLVQASLGLGSAPNRYKIYLRPTTTTVNASIGTLQFNVGVLSSVSPQPTMNVISTTLPGVTWEGFASPIEEGGWYNYQIYTLISPIILSTTANVEIEIMEIEFSGGPASPYNVALVTLPDGGLGASNGLSLFLLTGTELSSNGSSLYYARSNVIVSNNFSYDITGASNGTTTSTAIYQNIVLPVNWLDFTAIRQNNDALLNWSVASEVNNHHYEIERSTNGVSFTSINLVPSANPNGGRHDYQYIDANIKNLNSDIVYYRIKQVDLDGKFTYSTVKHIKLSKGDISIYPNPAKDGFQVMIPYLTTSDRNIQMKLENALGQVIETRVLNATQAANYYFRFSGAKVSSGNYTLRIYKDTELMETKKIIVAR